MKLPLRILLVCLAAGAGPTKARPADMERIQVSADKKGFVLAKSGTPFVPWGFNYDHDAKGRLIEDYWETEWPKAEKDFQAMRQMGANVVRVHLQLGKFMETGDKPSRKALEQLGRLLKLAEKERLYLDLTGLGCYHKKDVPAWYDKLQEKDRWAVQARFWHAVADKCSASPAVFCYDLMNEPVVSGGKRPGSDWLGQAFGGKHFVQFVSLDPKSRTRPEVARAWIETLAAEVRKADRGRLITVGLVDWSLDRPGLTSGFVPDKIAAPLDFFCVHLYPEKGKGEQALKTLAGFALGKPVVVEETFPLRCSAEELEKFIDGSKKTACGWIGFYWGRPPEELRQSKEMGDALTLAWLELFQRKAKTMKSNRR
jgi:Cellulase (glycosyl hydrolase family 5)